MPKKKVKWKPIPVVVEPEVEEEVNVESPTSRPVQEDDDVEEVISQLPQEDRIQLWRWDDPPGSQDWGYVGTYPPQGFSLDMVARTRGPGKYRLVIRGPREIEGRIKIVQKYRRVFVISGVATPPSAGGSTDLGLSVAEAFRMNLQLLQTVIAAQANQPRESMAQVVQAVAQLMKPAESPLTVALELAKLVKESGSKGGIDDLIEALRLGIDLAREGGGESSELATLGRALEKFVERIPPRSVTTPQQPQALAAALPSVPESAPQPAAEARDDVASLLELLAMGLAGPSQRDGDIDFYAQWVLEQVPDELVERVDALFGAPEYPAMLQDRLPGVYWPWARQVLMRARELYYEETTTGDDTDGLDSTGGFRH